MTITPTVLIEPKLAEATNTVQYTATGVNAIVDKFTVINNCQLGHNFNHSRLWAYNNAIRGSTWTK
jgi:hypothetical protein